MQFQTHPLTFGQSLGSRLHIKKKSSWFLYWDVGLSEAMLSVSICWLSLISKRTGFKLHHIAGTPCSRFYDTVAKDSTTTLYSDGNIKIPCVKKTKFSMQQTAVRNLCCMFFTWSFSSGHIRLFPSSSRNSLNFSFSLSYKHKVCLACFSDFSSVDIFFYLLHSSIRLAWLRILYFLKYLFFINFTTSSFLEWSFFAFRSINWILTILLNNKFSLITGVTRVCSISSSDFSACHFRLIQWRQFF